MICSSSQHTHFLCLLVFGFYFNRSWFAWIYGIKTSLHDLFYIHLCFNYLNKLSLIVYFMSLEFWYFNKTYFWILSQKHWYISSYVYWIISIYYMPQSYLNIMFLYLDEFWTKRIFNSKIQVLEKYGIWFSTKFLSYKNSSTCL